MTTPPKPPQPDPRLFNEDLVVGRERKWGTYSMRPSDGRRAAPRPRDHRRARPRRDGRGAARALRRRRRCAPTRTRTGRCRSMRSRRSPNRGSSRRSARPWRSRAASGSSRSAPAPATRPPCSPGSVPRSSASSATRPSPARAGDRLAELGVGNVEVVVADGTRGAPGAERFDAIAVHAAAPAVPQPLLGRLADGGRLVMPVTEGAADVLTLFAHVGSRLDQRTIAACRFVPLVAGEIL